jgi:hypothetical protein
MTHVTKAVDLFFNTWQCFLILPVFGNTYYVLDIGLLMLCTTIVNIFSFTFVVFLGLMAKAEHPEKYNWRLNELDSLGISTLQKNGLNNQKEASDLTEAVKQTLYEEYLQAYSESNR